MSSNVYIKDLEWSLFEDQKLLQNQSAQSVYMYALEIKVVTL